MPSVAVSPLRRFAASPSSSAGIYFYEYAAPAARWTEALPLGNGRLGAMVYGGVLHNTKLSDRIALNVDTLWWRGEVEHRHNPDALEGFREVRRLLLAGRVKEAEHLAKRTMTSCPKEQPPYVPLVFHQAQSVPELGFADHLQATARRVVA